MLAQKENNSIQGIAKVAAFGYPIDSFSHVLIPGYQTGPVYLALPIALAEIALPLRLLIKDMNTAKWKQRALESTLSPALAQS